MHLTPEFKKYTLFRVVSITFMMIAINYLLFRSESQDYLTGGVLLVVSIFFLLKYSKIRPTPPLATCLDKSNILVSNLVVLSITLGYGVAVLALFRAFTGDELKLEVITLSLLVLFLGAATYLYLCKKNRVVDKFS